MSTTFNLKFRFIVRIQVAHPNPRLCFAVGMNRCAIFKLAYTMAASAVCLPVTVPHSDSSFCTVTIMPRCQQCRDQTADASYYHSITMDSLY